MTIEISKEDSSYMYDIIQKIIDYAGNRMPGSPQEAKGAEIIGDELAKTCDEVSIEPFKLHPRAFLGWIKFDIILMLFSLGSYYLIQIIANPLVQIIFAATSFILMLIALFVTWKQFFNYEEFIDPLFKEKESQNVVGKIKAKGETNKIIIFSGHHDSALRFNLLEYLKWGYPIVDFWGIITLLLWFAVTFINLIFVILGQTDVFLGFTLNLIFISTLPLIGLWFFVSPGESANKVPGAVDNLSAVGIILGLGRHLKSHPEIIPENTEIRLISFGSEEAGLRGAYRYAAAHLDELKKNDAEIVNMDSIQSIKNVIVMEYEPTTRTQHSKEVIEKIKKSAELSEIKLLSLGTNPVVKVFGQISGGTDAAAFSKAGIKAASIGAIELSKFFKFYHQSTDTLDKISKGALEKCLKINIGYLINENKN